jgi:hypothetical protein
MLANFIYFKHTNHASMHPVPGTGTERKKEKEERKKENE